MDDEVQQKWVGGVCCKDGAVLLIHRINKQQVFNPEYFIFPGEMLGDDESIDQALTVEFSKLGLRVDVKEEIHNQEDGETLECYYRCDFVSGETDTTTREYTDDGFLQKFTAVWVQIKDLDDLIVYPETVKEALITENFAR